MTESDWLAAADPGPMLEFLRDRGRASERKLRVFAVACLRGLWDRLHDPTARRAVLAAEQFAHGALTGEQFRAAFLPAWRRGWEPVRSAAVAAAGPGEVTCSAAGRLAAVVASKWARPRQWSSRVPVPSSDASPTGRCAREDEILRAQAALLRDIFGNPFRPAPSLAPAVLAYDGGTVPKLAQAIYAERAFDRLPILADALEDAGCTDATALGHCRGGGEHVRGCWVVDLALGKG